MTSGPAEASDPLLATFDADNLRAALAVALFASTNDTLPALTHIRFTNSGDGLLHAQATDRYIAGVYRNLTGGAPHRLDVLISRAEALKVAKKLRGLHGDVAVKTSPLGGLQWLIEWTDRHGAPVREFLSWLPVDGNHEWPRTIPTLVAEESKTWALTCVDLVRLAAVGEWQKLAGGEYAPRMGAVLAPVGRHPGSHLRVAVTPPRGDGTVGLVALLCGVVSSVSSLDGPEALAAVAASVAAIAGGAPR